MKNQRRMHLGWLMNPYGTHPAAWLHPEAAVESDLDIGHYVRMARLAERGKLDFIFQADAPACRDGNMEALSRAPRFMSIWEPATLLAALAGATTHIGLGGTASTSYYEPYNIARLFGSLDHLSKGRAAWNVVTSAHPSTGYNFGIEGLEPHALRYERAEEFLQIVLALWDSWDDDAFVRDRERGRFFDPDKLHYLHHKGKHFSVRGPLNMARTPQGRPVIIQAGGSEPGKNLAAETADVVFSAAGTIEKSHAFIQDVKGRMAGYGRRPEHLAILPGLNVTIGRTQAEAEDKYAALQALIHPDVGRELLSDDLEGVDLSHIPLDGPVPLEALPKSSNGHKAYFEALIEAVTKEKLSLRQLYERHVARSGTTVRGTPTQIADKMEEWFSAGAADGFMLTFTSIPQGLEDFVTLVVPELQRRGLFRSEYEGPMLRDHLGIPRPESRYHQQASLTPAAPRQTASAAATA
jgi:FMN-dependent oxidoreductase (nitrilotriacetate monooxygenase family)